MKSALRRPHSLLLWKLVALALLVSTCSPQPSALKRVRTAGVLRVAATNSPMTCYDGPTGPTGYECDLLSGLTKSLGVKLEVHFVDNAPAALAAVMAGQADIAAAAINVTPVRAKQVRFSLPVQTVRQQLVYRMDHPKPDDLSEVDGHLTVAVNSSGAERLAQLRERFPDLKWEEVEGDGPEDLLYLVSNGELDYTVANSDLIAINQRYYPKLRVAFDLSDLQALAWALPNGPDDSLFDTVQNYLSGLGQATLERIRDRYFGHVGEDDYLGVVRFSTDVQSRLPRYRSHFETAAESYGIDWRLLAAIGYQESHWDASAVSYTGVKGIMMLTTNTAAELDVANREDPAQSIRGGAQYLTQILKGLPPSIEEPDRTWMALAAYNQGLGHLLDARELAEKRGVNPDHWVDVRDTLPLLSRERWFSTTTHGYARGREAVNFVANVRSYYDLLTWMSSDKSAPRPGEDPVIENKSAGNARSASRD
jgi:membrane-bound lytic murein transglycosylase F